jgi:hypothetical protein
MIDLDAVLEIEGEAETEEDYYLAIQRAINAGSWSLQGSFGRAMMDAISSGRCMLGKSSARDYWGNYIPSRDQVQSGTKGSPEFVEARRGADWLEMLESIDS